MKDYYYVNYCKNNNFYFQYIKTFSWLHVIIFYKEQWVIYFTLLTPNMVLIYFHYSIYKFKNDFVPSKCWINIYCFIVQSVIWVVYVLFTNACVVHIHKIKLFQTILMGFLVTLFNVTTTHPKWFLPLY
jgi:hypothetical protein